MKKNRLAALLLAMAMSATVLTGCAGPEDVDTPDDGASTQAPDAGTSAPAELKLEVVSEDDSAMTLRYGEYTFEIDKTIPIKDRHIVGIFENVVHQFGQILDTGIHMAGDEYGAKCEQMGGTDWIADESIDIIDNLIASGVDGLIIAAIDEEAFTAAAHRALEAGIPVVGYNSPMEQEARWATVGVDVYSVAEAVVTPFLKDIYDTYGGGKILVFGSLADNEPTTRKKALMDVAASYGDGVFDILEVNVTGDDTAVYSAIENAMLANSDIVGAYSVNGAQYVFGQYLKDNDVGNMKSDKPIFTAGHDLFPESLENVKDGWESYLVSQDPVNQGYVPTKMLCDFYTNYDISVFEDVYLDPVVVNADNVQTYLDKLAAGELVL